MNIQEYWALYNTMQNKDTGVHGVELSSVYYGRIVIGVGDTYEKAEANAWIEAEKVSTPKQRVDQIVRSAAHIQRQFEQNTDLMHTLREENKELLQELINHQKEALSLTSEQEYHEAFEKEKEYQSKEHWH